MAFVIVNEMNRCWNGQPPEDRSWFDPNTSACTQACPGPAIYFADRASAEAVCNRLLLHAPGAHVEPDDDYRS